MRLQAIREFVVAPRLLLFATVAVLATGCLSIKSYVDPQLPKLAYSDLLARPNPQPVGLTVDFHRNGKPATFGVSRARDEVRTAIERSKLFTMVTDKPTETIDRLEIVLDNVADLGDAAGPPGLTPAESIGAAFNKVVEELVLNLLLDLQKEERL